MLQSGHANNFVVGGINRQMDGQGETSIPRFNFVEVEGIISGLHLSQSSHAHTQGSFCECAQPTRDYLTLERRLSLAGRIHNAECLDSNLLGPVSI